MTTQVKRKHPLAECESCPLVKKACVPTDGPTNAEVAVVSRSPGQYDVQSGRPFTGPSGKVLDHLLSLYGAKREDTLVTNVVLCKTDKPSKEAISACRPRLLSELRNARTIIAAGSEAVVLFTKSGTVNSARGYVHKPRSEFGYDQGVRIIATNNPAVVTRDDSTFPDLVRDFKLALDPLPEPKLPDVDWTNDVAQGKRWLQILAKEKHPYYSIDIETKGLRASADLVSFAISADGSKAIAFGERICSDHNSYYSYLKPLIERRDTRFVLHNGKFDARNFRAHGINARVDEDTILLSWHLDERSDEEGVHKLDYLLMNELGWPNYESREIKEWKRTVGRLEKQFRFSELADLPTPEQLYEYNALDAGGTAQLFPILRKKAIADRVHDTYRRHSLRVAEALTTVELQGLPYDVSGACDILEEEVWPKLEDLTEEMRLVVGDGNYNPRSNPQNAELVYDEWKVIHNLNYPEEKARSVDKGVYTEIKAERFVIGGFPTDGVSKKVVRDTAIRWAERFADYQEWEKQRSTYLEGLAKKADAQGGILYTDFNLHTTTSGRISSKNPNLQNITRTKPHLPDIRSLFTSRPGCTFVNGDYSQAELRSIAALSRRGKLAAIYDQGLDLHDQVSIRFFGEDFTKENRQNVKNMNFGVAYLQSAETFQEKHDIPIKLAKPFIEWWWGEFPEVREWTNEIGKIVTTVGEVVSPFGHKRRFHLITRQNRNAAIREGINFVPQNTAANLTNHAVYELAGYWDEDLNYVPGRLDWEKAQVVLTVHDSILVNSITEYAEEAASIMHEVMVAAPMESIGWDFPFEVDLQIGERWGKMENLSVVASPGVGQ